MEPLRQRELKSLFDEVAGDFSGLLSLEQACRLVEAVGLEVAGWKKAGSVDEAVAAAGELGWPVVMKVASRDVVHKSDSGGVETGLKDEDAVRSAYQNILDRVSAAVPGAKIDGVTVHRQVSGVELVLGASKDPQFGPSVMVGVGGVLVELYQDVVFRVAPFGRDEALAALSELKGAKLLDGFRGADPVDKNAVADAAAALSELVAACPRIREVDLNPIFARADSVVAADLRIVVS